MLCSEWPDWEKGVVMVEREMVGNKNSVGLEVDEPAWVRWGRWGYLALAWILVGCVVAQVFFAGLAIFVDPADWALHTSFVHAFEFLPVLMLPLVFLGRLPHLMRWLTALLWVQIMFQYASANSGGTMAALHPVNAMLFFWVAVTLAMRAGRSVRRAASAR